jgi:initiation factor 1A
MVKSKRGGGKNRKRASKHSKAPERTFKMRLPKHEDETIAYVTKLYGYGHLNVLCNDGVERLCVIRKKFKGRNKRDNEIVLHAYILVGIRAYEVVAQGKKPKCDLLYVYSQDQQTQLARGAHIHSCLLKKTTEDAPKDCGIDISKDAPDEDAVAQAENTGENWLVEQWKDI